VQQRSYEEGPNFDKSTSNEDQPFWETTKVSTDLSSEEKREDNGEANTAMTRAPQKRTQSRKNLHPDCVYY